jgi:hypothetical protein
MSSSHSPRSPSDSPPSAGAERRRNPRLRELVDEMLASVRAAANVELWSTEERARYEEEMARIMANVRTQAFSAGPRARLD